MIAGLSERWRRVFQHLVRDAMTGAGFFLMALGFLLQDGGAFILYCLLLVLLLGIEARRPPVTFRSPDATLILFGLLLILVSADAFAQTVFFRQFLLPTVGAVVVAGRIRHDMRASAEAFTQQTTQGPESGSTAQGKGR